VLLSQEKNFSGISNTSQSNYIVVELIYVAAYMPLWFVSLSNSYHTLYTVSQKKHPRHFRL